MPHQSLKYGHGSLVGLWVRVDNGNPAFDSVGPKCLWVDEFLTFGSLNTVNGTNSEEKKRQGRLSVFMEDFPRLDQDKRPLRSTGLRNRRDCAVQITSPMSSWRLAGYLGVHDASCLYGTPALFVQSVYFGGIV